MISTKLIIEKFLDTCLNSADRIDEMYYKLCNIPNIRTQDLSILILFCLRKTLKYQIVSHKQYNSEDEYKNIMGIHMCTYYVKVLCSERSGGLGTLIESIPEYGINKEEYSIVLRRFNRYYIHDFEKIYNYITNILCTYQKYSHLSEFLGLVYLHSFYNLVFKYKENMIRCSQKSKEEFISKYKNIIITSCGEIQSENIVKYLIPPGIYETHMLENMIESSYFEVFSRYYSTIIYSHVIDIVKRYKEVLFQNINPDIYETALYYEAFCNYVKNVRGSNVIEHGFFTDFKGSSVLTTFLFANIPIIMTDDKIYICEDVYSFMIAVQSTIEEVDLI